LGFRALCRFLCRFAASSLPTREGYGDARTARPGYFVRLRYFAIHSPEYLKHGGNVAA
jgi:hypothetical protein